MAEAEGSFDPLRTVVVTNIPGDVNEDDLTIHFQKEKNGGGDVDYIELTEDGSKAFVTFDMTEVTTSILSYAQTINGSSLEVQSYDSWLKSNKKKQEKTPVDNTSKDTGHARAGAGHEAPAEDAVTTIFVSGIKESTTKDAITLFFENKRRSGGGELKPDKTGFKRISPTIARLTYESSQDAGNVLKKANETQLQLDGNLLTVSTVFVPTHDRSILLAKNMNPKTSEDTLKDFVEATKNVEVQNIIFGKDSKAIVILKEEIDEDPSDDENVTKEMMLEDFAISLEFAPLTKRIRIQNIPPSTSSDAIRFKFSNKKIGGSKVTDLMLDQKNGVANVYFEEFSAVSKLVKNEHQFENIPLTVIPFYDDFEVQEEVKTTEFSGEYDLDPLVMVFIMNHHQIESMFELKSMKFDDKASRIRFTKEFDDSKDAVEFEKKLKEFLQSFHKEEVRIPKIVFEKVKETIKQRREGIEDDTIDVSFGDLRVILVGKKDQVTLEKEKVEKMIDTYSEQFKLEPHEFKIDDEKKLNFLNLIGYSMKLATEFPEVKIHGMDSGSGKMTLFGTSENVKDVKLRILHDLSNIAEIDLKMSDREIDFLQRTDCQIVNDELKKGDVMLILKPVKGHVGAKGLQAKIMTLRKCDDTEEKRLMDIALTKTSEKCIKVDENTAKLLAKSNKLQEFKKEQFDQHKVMVDPELTDPCNIWIVCEKSKMNQAEQDLGDLIDVKKITSSTFKPMEAMKVRFLKEYCWDKIKEKQHNNSCQAEGVVVEDDADPGALKITGTKAGRNEIINFLENLSKKVECKAYPVTEPGMKKQMRMETTTAVIAGIEKSHRCVIEHEIPPEKPEMAAKGSGEELPEDAVIVDGGLAAEAGTPTMNLPYHRMSFVNDKEVKITSSGQKISIVVGDLAQQKVDVIVNTTNEKVDLKANPCGKALLKVAGKELLNECQKIGSLQAGGMASTGPAKLKCQRVYHVRSSHWDNGKGAPILRQLIKNCLDQVEKDKLTSIAIPAIGTGNLHFPRPEVAKIFFEEVVGFFTAHPQSAILDVRFVAYSGDQPSVDAFLAAVQKIKSMVSGPPIRVTSISSKSVQAKPIPRKRKPTASHLTNVTTTEKPDGSLEFSLGKISVQIVCSDISKETTDLIMHVTNQEFSFQGGVGKAIIKAGGDSIVNECKALVQPGHYTTQFTKAGNLSVNEIAHVIGTGQPTYPELKQCLDNFFDELSKKNFASVSFSSIGAGAMGFSESQSADLIFDNLSRMAESKNPIPPLKLARIVIFEKPKFVKFKDAAKAYLATGGASSSISQPKASFSPKGSFNVFRKRSAKPSSAENGGISIKIYSDDRGTRDKAWKELEKQLLHYIDEKSVNDEIIKKFSDKNVEIKLHQLESKFDVKITMDKGKGNVKIKGYTKDVSTVQEEIHAILNDLKEIVAKESKVPDYWDGSAVDGKVFKIPLDTASQEYKNIETDFRKTAPNQIVRIERIQNKGIYELYNLKRETMMNKYGSNFAGKELMLFHGTSQGNIDFINADGLNRSYAGIHATVYGRGVYFARDASYSCNQRYSPPDPQGLRYMYYAKVLVGEYTVGNSSMLVPPPKNPSDPNDSYNSVVDDMSNPGIYVMFQDYEYYTEYLITFK